MMQSITLSHIFKFAHSSEILTDISVQLNPGEKYGLIGSNGCGKTTLLNVLSQFIEQKDRVIVIEDTQELQVNTSS